MLDQTRPTCISNFDTIMQIAMLLKVESFGNLWICCISLCRYIIIQCFLWPVCLVLDKGKSTKASAGISLKTIRITCLCLSLPQNGIRSRSPRRCKSTILDDICITTGMIYSTSYLYSIHPNKVLDFFVSGDLEFLLTDRTRCICKSVIAGYRYVSSFRIFLSCVCTKRSRILIMVCGIGFQVVSLFSKFDPFLFITVSIFLLICVRFLLTISSTYQLLLNPLWDDSARRRLVWKCQSKCLALSRLPSSVARNRFPQVVH